jgi:Immunity protein 52
MYEIKCKFHLSKDSPWHDASNALEALRPYARWLGEHDPTLRRWWLGGETLEEANRYEVFVDGVNAHTAANAVFSEQYKKSREPVVFLWNGEEDDDRGASLVLSITDSDAPSYIKFAPGGPIAGSRIGDYAQTAEFVAMLARDTLAIGCYVYSDSGYGRRMTFKDRDGVGWMCYLPIVLTSRDVPEARAVLPVVDGNKTQLGTILVSVTDSVFDYRNAEHLKISQAIETRLVSNDWLPTWAQMMKPVG